MYSQGLGIEANNDIAASLSAQASNDNNSKVFLGEAYHSINSKLQNFPKALEYYQNTSDDDTNKSCSLRGIGLLYEHGDVVEQSYEKAFDYYMQSAERENKGAYYNLALLYYYGKGVNQSFESALECFNRVIAEEPKISSTYVFVQVEDDSESDLITEKQRKYSMVFENVIYGEAHYFLGIMCKEGEGTEKDNEKAMYHFKIAHLNGIERAQKYLDLKY